MSFSGTFQWYTRPGHLKGVRQGSTQQPGIALNPNKPWTGIWKVGGWRHFTGPWAIKQNGTKVVSTKKSLYSLEGKVIGNRIDGWIMPIDPAGRMNFSIKMSEDGNSFKGKVKGPWGNRAVSDKRQ